MPPKANKRSAPASKQPPKRTRREPNQSNPAREQNTSNSDNETAENVISQRLTALETQRNAFMEQYAADQELSTTFRHTILDEIRSLRQDITERQSHDVNENPQISQFTGNDSNSQSDIKQYWPWIDLGLAQDIAAGDFDIQDLPKLHPHPETRLRHTTQIARATNLQVPLNSANIQPTIVVGNTKLSRCLNDFNAFVPAWLVYCAIRGYYNHDYLVPLQVWTIELSQISIGAQWKFVLDYIISFYDVSKAKGPEAWLDVNAVLISRYITVPTANATYNLINGSNPRATNRSPSSMNSSTDICINYNTKGCNFQKDFGTPCKRKHVCRTCSKPGHTQQSCTSTRTQTVNSQGS